MEYQAGVSQGREGKYGTVGSFCYPLRPGESHVVLSVFGPKTVCESFWDFVYRDDRELLSLDKIIPLSSVRKDSDFYADFCRSFWGVSSPLFRQVWFEDRFRLSFVVLGSRVPSVAFDFLSEKFPELFFVSEYVFLDCSEIYGSFSRIQGIMVWYQGSCIVDILCSNAFGDVFLDNRDFCFPAGAESDSRVYSWEICKDLIVSLHTQVSERLVQVLKDRDFLLLNLKAGGIFNSFPYRLFALRRLVSMNEVLSRMIVFLDSVGKKHELSGL